MIPTVNDVLPGKRLDLLEIHEHAICGITLLPDYVARKSHLKHIAMPMQMSALAFVIGNPVTGIEFEATGNAHDWPKENVAADYIIGKLTLFSRREWTCPPL